MSAFFALLAAATFTAALAAVLAACGILTVRLARPAPRKPPTGGKP